MNMLAQIGIVPEVVVYQFVIFVITMFILSRFVFTPFQKNNELRRLKTTGSTDSAADLIKKSAELNQIYADKAKAHNSELMAIIQSSKNKAQQKYNELVATAKEASEQILADNSQKIEAELQAAQKNISAEASTLSLIITNKLLEK